MSERAKLPNGFWPSATVASTALVLSAFWSLLGFRYSPETYGSGPTVVGTLEFAWAAAAVVATILALAALRRRLSLCRPLVQAALPLLGVSAMLVTKACFHSSMESYDVILFSSACGWTVLRGNHAVACAQPLDWPKRYGLWTLGIAIAALGFYYMWQQINYLNNLALGFPDCGYFARQLFYSVHFPQELFLRMDREHPLFWSHFEPGAALFVPLWAVWPSVKLLILLQVAAILVVALPLYGIGKRLLRDDAAALLLAASWLVHPSSSQFIYSASYGFRWGNLCFPLYFLALLLWLHQRRGWALAVAGAALLFKEEAAILLGMFGLYLALWGGARRAGIWLAAGGFAYFFLITGVVMPALSGKPYVMLGAFSQLGDNQGAILFSPVANSKEFWGKLFHPSTFYFGAMLLAPLLFLPLKKSSVLFVGALTFFFVALWNTPLAKSICYQYQAGLLPVLFWATACAVETETLARRRCAMAGVVVASAVLSIFFGNSFWSKQAVGDTSAPGRLELLQRFALRIDRDSVLVATPRAAAHFLQQRHLYLTGSLPPDTDFVLLDLRDRWRPTSGQDWLASHRAFQRRVEAREDLHLVAAEDGLLLYARKGLPLDARAIVERDALPSTATAASMEPGHGVKTVGYSLTVDPAAGRVEARARVSVYNTVVAPTAADLAARCLLQYRRGAVVEEAFASEFQPLGQGIWPVKRWQAGKVYLDEFILRVPPPLPGQSMAVSFEAQELTTAPTR